MTKEDLRKEIYFLKKRYSPDEKREKSEQIIKQLITSKKYKNARSILCYWSLPDEVHTHDFIIQAAKKKEIFLPVVSGDSLLLRKFTGVSDLVKGMDFSIPEPKEGAKQADLSKIDIVILPGLAFDRKGMRLGRGKGFYDKLLSGAEIFKIGICFDFQVVDEVPFCPSDIPVNQVIFG